MCEAFLPETKESVSGLQGAKEAQGFSTNCLPLSDPCFWDSKVSRFDMPLLCVFAFQVSNHATAASQSSLTSFSAACCFPKLKDALL